MIFAALALRYVSYYMIHIANVSFNVGFRLREPTFGRKVEFIQRICSKISKNLDHDLKPDVE